MHEEVQSLNCQHGLFLSHQTITPVVSKQIHIIGNEHLSVIPGSHFKEWRESSSHENLKALWKKPHKVSKKLEYR